MYYALLVLLFCATAAFALSLTAHVMTFTGGPMPFGKNVWVLHFAVIGLAGIAAFSRRIAWKGPAEPWWERRYITSWLAGGPKWLTGVAYALVGYSFLTMVLSFGKFAAAEGNNAMRLWVRPASTLWMLLSALAAGALWLASERVAAQQKPTSGDGGPIDPD